MTSKISATAKRKILIQAFYKYQLLDANLNYIKQDILDDAQDIKDQEVYNEIEKIATNTDDIIESIKPHLSTKWKWERIPSVIRSILIVGVYEIKYTDTPKAVTINEMVEYTKSYVPDFDFKFVNAILDKIEEK
ncbi:transcription antitermination factor NusB [Mycoplasma yeatsii]|uniref:N utilization substance protein B n=1 Tax=Mycoplasma yeatsii TaxID=51365 RepID=A0ABU0NGR3_9MOLU|nr:transcription antitermination factor NusB [Mycoplasma yeatsii]AJM71735.1 transcription antitermination factor NusB [Mycoplasma yeatsii GM274B]MDQ0568094.1 N utilization substance protein B [Mycoplasma yeatsii]